MFDCKIHYFRYMAVVALVVISAASGASKPCRIAFGADQLPEEDPKLVSYFISVVTLDVQAGGLISILIAPHVR